MSGWPDAPRLTAALNDRAAEIEPAERRDEILGGQSSGSSLSGARVAVEGNATGRGLRGRRSVRHHFGLSVAAVVLALGGLAALVVNRTDEAAVVVDTAAPGIGATTVAPQTQSPDPRREFTTLEPCVAVSDEAQSIALDADDGSRVEFVTIASGRASNAFNRFISLSDQDPLRQVSDGVQLAPDERQRIEYVDTRSFESVADFDRFRGAMLQSLCDAAVPSLVATGPAAAKLAVDFACTYETNPGLQGLALVDDVLPPADGCVRSRPTYLIGSTAVDDFDVQRWAAFQGCSGPETVTDAVGNEVTRWKSCESTLVHVRTATSSAWDSDGIEAVSIHRFIASIALVPK